MRKYQFNKLHSKVGNTFVFTYKPYAFIVNEINDIWVMFRLSRFGFGIARKARIPLKGREGRLLMPNFSRMYRRQMKRSESVTFEAQDLGNYVEDNEEEEVKDDNGIQKFSFDGILPNISDVIRSQGNKINWDNVIEESLKATRTHNLNKEIIKGHIVRACEMNKSFPELISYFEYLIENKELCAGMLYLICDAVKTFPEELSKCVDIINEVRKKLLPEQGIALTICLAVLLRDPKYRNILRNENGNIVSPALFEEDLSYYFNNNDVDGAFKLLDSGRPDRVFSSFPHFFNYFEHCADMGEIPVSRFVMFFDKVLKESVYFTNDYIHILTKLISKLNKLDKAYMWFCKPSGIGEYCKLCSGKLQKVDISQEEVDILKVEIEKNVIYGQNINIKSTRTEWKSFVQYINKKPYNIVIDGLNVWFAYQRDPVAVENLLKYMEEKELTPLTIARKHFVSSSAYSVIHNKYPFFLAADLSDDDVFVMYAALNKGKNCYLMSNDQMGFARTSIGSPNLEEMFLRWQALHQCYTSKNGTIIFPHGMALGLQKSPSKDKEEFRYHLVVKDGSYRKLYCISRLKRQ